MPRIEGAQQNRRARLDVFVDIRLTLERRAIVVANVATPKSMIPIVICFALSLLLPGCTVHREAGRGRQLGSYDYCLVTQREAQGYFEDATTILNQSFVVLHEDDPRLNLARVHQKTCTVSIEGAHGFWSSSGWVDVRDLGTSEPVHTSHMRRGMFWAGTHDDVMEAIRDVAAARAAGPPLPPDARDPADARTIADEGHGGSEPAASVEERLRRLDRLYDTGAITKSEYERKRHDLIDAL
jgi:hypothetical protein